MCNAFAWPQQCWKSCANGSNIVVRHVSATTEQKKCWELLAQKFDQFQTLRNTSQQFPTPVQTDATCNIQQSVWELAITPLCKNQATLPWMHLPAHCAPFPVKPVGQGPHVYPLTLAGAGRSVQLTPA